MAPLLCDSSQKGISYRNNPGKANVSGAPSCDQGKGHHGPKRENEILPFLSYF